MFELSSEKDVQDYTPDFYTMVQLPYRAIIITAKSNRHKIDFVSRVFAPSLGVDEDPATGIAYCVLGKFWASKYRKRSLKACQLSRRGQR